MSIEEGTIYSEIRIRLDKLTGDINQVNQKLGQLTDSAKGDAGQVEKSWTDSFGKMNLAAVAAFAGITLAIRQSIGVFANFEQELANVRAVAGATPEEFARLEAAALSAGETTRFSASQAAEALYNLASAGLDATQSTEALDSVLMLAGATGADLGQASAALTATLSQYGIAAADAGRVTNVFAASIANSQANLDKLQTSFAIVGPVAAGFGVSIEETAGALQLLFNAGLDASTAGTALRNALAQLASQSSPTISRLNQLGVSFESVDPSANSLAEIIGVLGEAGLSTGEIMEAFGQRAGPALLTLIDQGRAGLEEYTAAVTDTNAAADAYATQNDTLQGSIDSLNSVIEATQIAFARELAPALRAATEFASGFFRIIKDLPGPVKLFLLLLAGGIPLVLGGAAAFSTLAAAVGAALGPITLVVAALAGTVAVITGITSAINAANTRRLTAEYGELAQQLGVSADEAKRLADEAERMQGNVEEVQELVDSIGVTSQQLREFNDILASYQMEGFATNAARDIQTLAEFLGISVQDAINLALQNSNITEEYRSQLETLQRISNTDDARSRQLAARQAALERQQRQEQEARDAAERAEQARLEAERAREARRESLIAGRVAAEQRYQDEAANTQRLLDIGYIDQEEANNRLVTANNRLIEALVELGYTGQTLQLGDQAIRRAQEELARLNATLEASRREYEATQAAQARAAEEANRLKGANIELGAVAEDYNQRLRELTSTTDSLQALERQRAREQIIALKAGEEATQRALAELDRYYAALASSQATEEASRNLSTFAQEADSIFRNLLGNLSGLFEALADKRIQEIDRQLQAELAAAGLAEQTEIERLNEQLKAAQEAGDEEKQLAIQNQVARLEIEKEYEKRKAQVRYDADLASWRATLLIAVADAAAAIIRTAASVPFPLNIPLTAAQAGANAVNIAAIAASKPEPPRLATGALVMPRPGGVPVITAENGSPELIFGGGSQGEAFLRQFANVVADQLNKTLGNLAGQVIELKVGREVLTRIVVDDINNGRARLT